MPIVGNHPIYSFFFHPLDESHSTCRKILSLITTIALAIITVGLYFALFALVRYMENKKIEPMHTTTPQTKLEHLIAKQSDHLKKLKALAQKGEWEHLQTHTFHPDSGFDWWMFPIQRPSSGYGDKYAVSLDDVATLKKNKEFMEHYREGVILVAKSWGWDLTTGKDISNSVQKWTGYEVRLGKMLDSLRLFGQKELHQHLVTCIDRQNLRFTLGDWIQKLI